MLLLPATASLALFAWLLTLYSKAAGRLDAAYGAVDGSVALVWLPWVAGVPLTSRDLLGGLVLIAWRIDPSLSRRWSCSLRGQGGTHRSRPVMGPWLC